MKKGLFCQYFCTGLSNEDHIFDLSGQAIVNGVYGPAIVFINIEIGTPLIDHRFDGKHHAGNKNHFAPLRGDIADKRFFVEFQSDPMAADLFYNGVTVALRVSPDGIGDISRCPQGLAWASPRSTHSCVTRRSLLARGDKEPMANIREASE